MTAIVLALARDGPAIEYADGGGAWYRHGQLHREDGPAIEYADGGPAWRVNGRDAHPHLAAIESFGPCAIELRGLTSRGEMSVRLVDLDDPRRKSKAWRLDPELARALPKLAGAYLGGPALEVREAPARERAQGPQR